MKSGFIDKTGNLVIPCKWEVVGDFHEGLASVRNSNGNWGYIDKTGKLVIPCKWEVAYEFSEGLAVVQDSNGKCGYIDKTGNLVIPCKWEAAGYRHDDLFCVTKTGKRGIFELGKSAGDFHEGLAIVQDSNGKCGYIDKTGNLVIPCKWEVVGDFHEGLAIVQDSNGKCGCIDKTGKLVIPCEWNIPRMHFVEVQTFHEGLAVVKDSNGKCGCIDKTGNLVIPCQWKGSFGYCGFYEGLAVVQDSNGRCGYIDKTGNLVIPCSWKVAERFSEGLAVVQNYVGYGFIEKTGNLVIPYSWKRAYEFSEGLARVWNGEGFGYIDKTGKMVVQCMLTNARDFSEGLAYVNAPYLEALVTKPVEVKPKEIVKEKAKSEAKKRTAITILTNKWFIFLLLVIFGPILSFFMYSHYDELEYEYLERRNGVENEFVETYAAVAGLNVNYDVWGSLLKSYENMDIVNKLKEKYPKEYGECLKKSKEYDAKGYQCSRASDKWWSAFQWSCPTTVLLGILFLYIQFRKND